jgi:hypothetical protein
MGCSDIAFAQTKVEICRRHGTPWYTDVVQKYVLFPGSKRCTKPDNQTPKVKVVFPDSLWQVWKDENNNKYKLDGIKPTATKYTPKRK